MRNLTITLCLTIAVLLGSLLVESTVVVADMTRGLENYQAVISGQKELDALSAEELREVLTIHEIMKRRSSVSGQGCDAAYGRCVNSCESESSYFDYDSGDFKLITDVESKCEDACRDGERACD